MFICCFILVIMFFFSFLTLPWFRFCIFSFSYFLSLCISVQIIMLRISTIVLTLPCIICCFLSLCYSFCLFPFSFSFGFCNQFKLRFLFPCVINYMIISLSVKLCSFFFITLHYLVLVTLNCFCVITRTIICYMEFSLIQLVITIFPFALYYIRCYFRHCF